MHSMYTSGLTIGEATGAVLIACTYIAICSLIKEPHRKTLNALVIAGAGTVYWSGGLALWEYAFGSLMLFVAWQGLHSYRYIALGWMLHTGWDVMHHLYGHPIVYADTASSAGCAVCDPILALWFFMGAPSVFRLPGNFKTA